MKITNVIFVCLLLCVRGYSQIEVSNELVNDSIRLLLDKINSDITLSREERKVIMKKIFDINAAQNKKQNKGAESIQIVSKEYSKLKMEKEIQIQKLIKIASDTLVSQENRVIAIKLLADSENKLAYNFLLQNLTKIVFPESDYEGDISEMRQYPCFWYINIRPNGKDWFLFPLLIEALKQPDLDLELGYIAFLFEHIIGSHSYAVEILKAYKSNPNVNNSPASSILNKNIDEVVKVFQN